MTQPTPGRVLADRYRLEAPIARGGMASVWLARDELLGRRVAVKALHSDLAGDEKLRARFRQEAIAAAGLSHPNIVATYDTGEDDGLAFIVMELVEGESLRQLLDRNGALDVRVSVEIARQVSAALEAAHRNGIVHRDVKPANVLVPNEGPVKVTDFGIAKATGGDGDFTRTGMVVGTARYLSPEQVQGQPTDARTDVYALGLVLYEMLAGRPAYQGDSEMSTALARLTGPPAPLGSVRPDVPAGLVAVLDQALQPDPAHRIPSAAAFGQLLERGPDAMPPRPRPAATATPTPAPARSRPVEPTRTQAQPRPAPRSAPKRKRRGGWLRVVAFVVFLALLGVAAGLLTARLLDDDRGGGGNSSGNGGGGNGGATTGVAIDNSEIIDFDPFGTENPPQENREQAVLAADGLADTEWHSETYNTRNFGNAKPGVGLVLSLPERSDVSAVEIDANAGSDVAIYVADEAGKALTDWGAPRVTKSDLPANARVELSPSARGRFVLVWFTLLPESRRLDVSEIRVV